MIDQSTDIDVKALKSILDEMEFYRKGMANLRKKLLKALPEKFIKYGSDIWWEKSDMAALESIKSGKGRKFSTIEEAKKYLLG